VEDDQANVTDRNSRENSSSKATTCSKCLVIVNGSKIVNFERTIVDSDKAYGLGPSSCQSDIFQTNKNELFRFVMDWQDECCDPYRGAYAAGQELGYQSRRRHDYHDGYITGRNTAIEYGMELGFITGVAEHLTTVMPQLPDRVQRTWHDLQELLETFPTAHEILNTIAADTPSTQVPLEAKTNVDA
jgi:hypothetical protein